MIIAVVAVVIAVMVMMPGRRRHLPSVRRRCQQ
jgi:hypothetical protein